MPATFTDSKGREWAVEIDLQTADDIKKEFGVDLIDTANIGQTFVALGLGSTERLIQVVRMLTYEQAQSRGIAPEDFGRAMKPENIRAAFKAIQEAIADFSQSPDMAEAKRRLFRAAEAAVKNKVNELTEEFFLAKMSDANVGASPGS